MFSLQQNRRIRGQNRFCPEVVQGMGGGMSQAMYTHVSKCKNNKIKGEKKTLDKIQHL
jgi:hypothetical protein